MTDLDLRAATFNISGGEKTFQEIPNNTKNAQQNALEMMIKRLDADLLCVQEVSQYIDADGVTHSMMDVINQAGDYPHSFYGKTLSMETHLQVKKDVMVQGIFNDWWNWSKGNGIHSRLPFARLGDPTRSGVPRNIPLFQPQSYEGNRDTDPRFALLARLKHPPFPFIATVHLTTLVGERPPHTYTHKIEAAHLMRYKQIERFLDLVSAYILEKGAPLIFMGDFNAAKDEFCIAHLLEKEKGFIRLTPENEGPTHPNLKQAIDHIFFFPKERLVDYACRIITNDLSHRASDHLPVVAELQIKN